MALKILSEVIVAVLMVIVSLDDVFTASIYDDGDPFSDCHEPMCMVLHRAETKKITPLTTGKTRLFTFCHPGVKRDYINLWINPKLTIMKSSETQKLNVHVGRNLTEVTKNANSGSSWWMYLMPLMLQVKTDISLKPFNHSCIGVSSDKEYTVDFKVKNPELWYIAYVTAGVILFFMASTWSRNVMIYYSAGVGVGVFASILLLVYVLQRFLPQRLKSIGYLSLFVGVGGMTSLGLLHWATCSLHETLRDNWQYVLGYVIVTGVLSFAVVYRYGPVQEPRALNLIKWMLQAVGLALVYFGTQIQELSVAIMILTFVVYMFPWKHVQKLRRTIRYNFFPPKPRFLTEEEYLEQKDRETERALEELRHFCKSPLCDSWRVISRIKSPSRFASFVEGDDHLSDDDHYQHDLYSTTLPHTDDSDMSEIESHLTLNS